MVRLEPSSYYSRSLHVRFTAEEFDCVLSRWESVGGESFCSFSSFIRSLLFVSDPLVVITAPHKDLLNLDSLRELGRKINAIAYLVNQSHSASDAQLREVANLLIAMSQELSRLLKLLSTSSTVVVGQVFPRSEKLRYERLVRVSPYQYERVQSWKRKENKSMRTVLMNRLCATPFSIVKLNCDIGDLNRIVALTESNVRQINRRSSNMDLKITLVEVMSSISRGVKTVRDHQYALHKEERWLRS